jgi:hypothetical protein
MIAVNKQYQTSAKHDEQVIEVIVARLRDCLEHLEDGDFRNELIEYFEKFDQAVESASEEDSVDS